MKNTPGIFIFTEKRELNFNFNQTKLMKKIKFYLFSNIDLISINDRFICLPKRKESVLFELFFELIWKNT